MTVLVEKALALWGMEDAKCTFVAGRENQVYRVTSDAGDFAMRFKRPGYRSAPELLSELQWMNAMDRAGLHVPQPHPSLSGKLLEDTGTHFVDLIGWLSGQPIGNSRERLDLPDAPGTFRLLGRELARLHNACDAWTPPKGFIRQSWDAEGLLGEAPLWGRFWENPTVDAQTRDMLVAFRARASRDLNAIAKAFDYGLIHGDLVRENVLLDGEIIRLIDFDDGVFGYRLFDVATTLIKNTGEPDFDALKAALLEGYRSLRALDEKQLDLFMALRAVTYVGWIVPRLAEDGSPRRNKRFIADAQLHCVAYLAQPQFA